ncbi:MAG: hypothetical protein P1P84_04740 [Deferrisomatales bacterium]|nr:hypothetical protein [Deferrisomatales bacterium]
MECAYARLPGGRGLPCTAWRAPSATRHSPHADGVSRHGVGAFQDLSGPAGVRRTHIRISTEKVGGLVLLRIDSMALELQAGAV